MRGSLVPQQTHRGETVLPEIRPFVKSNRLSGQCKKPMLQRCLVIEGFMGDSVERYYLLDILRGLAAIAVVLRHYRNFYFVGPRLPTDFNAGTLPFTDLLWPMSVFS